MLQSRKVKLEAKLESSSSYLRFKHCNHGGQGESLVPPYTRRSVSLSSTAKRERDASACMRRHQASALPPVSSTAIKGGQAGVSLGSTWGQPGINLGKTWGQPWINVGSIRGQPAPPYHVVILRQPRHLTIRRGDAELAADQRAIVCQLPVPDA